MKPLLFVLTLSLLGTCLGLDVKVVISPGEPRQVPERIREIALYVYDISVEQQSQGIVRIYETESRSKLLTEFSLANNTLEVISNSIRVGTGLYFAPTNYSRVNPPVGCVNFISDIYINNTLQASGCLRTQPNWIDTHKKQIGDLPLKKLSLPGSHDAGSYRVYDDFETFFDLYRDAQEEDLFTQMLYGARFFDLRVGMIEAKEQSDFYIFHGILETNNTLKTLFSDVKTFLSLFPNEIVILDMHLFPVGFTEQAIFDKFSQLIEDMLGSIIIRGDLTSLTLNQILDTKQRVVITFNVNAAMKKKYNNGVYNVWANTDVIGPLRDYFQNNLPKLYNSNWFHSAMAELTPQGVWNIVLDTYKGGIRGLANRNNFRVSCWFQDRDLTSPSMSLKNYTTIVAVDYFAGIPITDICININIERAKALSRKNPLSHF